MPKFSVTNTRTNQRMPTKSGDIEVIPDFEFLKTGILSSMWTILVIEKDKIGCFTKSGDEYRLSELVTGIRLGEVLDIVQMSTSLNMLAIYGISISQPKTCAQVASLLRQHSKITTFCLHHCGIGDLEFEMLMIDGLLKSERQRTVNLKYNHVENVDERKMKGPWLAAERDHKIDLDYNLLKEPPYFFRTFGKIHVFDVKHLYILPPDIYDEELVVIGGDDDEDGDGTAAGGAEYEERCKLLGGSHGYDADGDV